jgi:hypothetical protein
MNLKMMQSVQNERFTFEIDSAAESESENALVTVTVGSESSLSCDTASGTLKRYSVPVTQPGTEKSLSSR